MTFVFRISSFAFVVVLATKSTLMVMDNQHSIAHKGSDTLIHLLDEGFKHREELREANDDVVFAAQAVTIMAVRVIDSCITAYHTILNKISGVCLDSNDTIFSAGITAQRGNKKPVLMSVLFSKLASRSPRYNILFA